METKTEMKKKLVYEEKGQVMGSMQNVIALILMFGVGVILYIFTGVIAGQTYQITEADITAIDNGTVEASIKDGIINGFEGYEQLGNYMPLLVLALILGVILSVLLGVVAFTGIGFGGRGGGSSL